MEGYVKNISRVPFYIMKRFVSPGESLSADELKERYFGESGATTDDKLIEWLKTTVFLDTTVWEVNLSPSRQRKHSTSKQASTEVKRSSTPHVVKTTPKVKVDDLDPAKLLKMSAPDCKKALDKCTDTKFLKQLLAKAEKMARKQKTCKVLREKLADLGAI